jgi:hypothetical protein
LAADKRITVYLTAEEKRVYEQMMKPSGSASQSLRRYVQQVIAGHPLLGKPKAR